MCWGVQPLLRSRQGWFVQVWAKTSQTGRAETLDNKSCTPEYSKTLWPLSIDYRLFHGNHRSRLKDSECDCKTWISFWTWQKFSGFCKTMVCFFHITSCRTTALAKQNWKRKTQGAKTAKLREMRTHDAWIRRTDIHSTGLPDWCKNTLTISRIFWIFPFVSTKLVFRSLSYHFLYSLIFVTANCKTRVNGTGYSTSCGSVTCSSIAAATALSSSKKSAYSHAKYHNVHKRTW